MKFLQRGLMFKLMIYFLILSLIPLTIIGYMAFVNGRAALEVGTVNRLTTARTLKEGEMNTWISEKNKNILFLSKTDENSKNLAILATYEKGDPVYMASYAELLSHFETLVNEEPDFREIFYVAAVQGEVLISTTRINEGRDVSNEAYFLEGKKGSYVGEVQISLELGRPAITLAIPVKVENGAVVGVIAGRVNLDKMDSIMAEKAGLGETGETYLINGLYRYASDPRLVAGIPIKKELHTEGIDDCLSKKEGVGLYENYRGIPVIGSYKWMDGVKLCILAEISQKEAFESILRFQNIVMTMTIVIAFFIIVFVFFLSHSIIKPINQLVRATEQIGGGALQYKIDIDSKDEVGKLAKSFNKMTHNLEGSQKRLVHSEKMASLGRLAAGVAHEINTPLTNISTSAQILMRKMDDSDPKMERLKVVEENVNLATNIVKGLLEFSRQPKPKFEELNVNDLLIRTLKMLKYQIIKVEVIKDTDPDLPMIFGDSGQLQQVFINLIVNACQAMPKGGKLTISTKRRDDFIEIAVKDTGPGITKENMDKIFDPFFTTREYGEGTGLGLSISHGIIERHNGRIEAKSKIGGGTTFIIELPVGEKE